MSQGFSKMKFPIVMSALVAMGGVAVGSSLLHSRSQAARADSPPAVKSPANAADSKTAAESPQADIKAVSYILGANVAESMREQKFGIAADDFIAGSRTALAGEPMKYTEEQVNDIMMAFQKQKMEEFIAEQQKMSEEALKKGEEFLAKNKEKDGIKETESGLQYRVIKEGTGEKPSASDRVRVHYRGTLTDGTEFDSSYRRGQPAEFMVGGVIPGWTEALQMMPQGSKWELYIPAKLAYGPRGAGNVIGPNEVLVFEVELLDVMNEEASEPLSINLSKTGAAGAKAGGGEAATSSSKEDGME